MFGILSVLMRVVYHCVTLVRCVVQAQRMSVLHMCVETEQLPHYHLGKITGSMRVQTIKCLIAQLWSCVDGPHTKIKQANRRSRSCISTSHTPTSLFVISHNKVVNWREIYLTTLDVCQISIGH